MTELTVRRLSVTARADEGAWETGRLDRLMRRVAEDRLDLVVRAAGLPSGIWCLRRLDVPVRLDPARPDPALEEAWAAALVAALRKAMVPGSADAVRYASEREALLDLLCGAATGRTARAWAWRRAGVLRAGDPEPDRAPKPLLLALLLRYAHQAPALVTDAADRVGLPALHRALGTDGWSVVAEAVRAAALGEAVTVSGRPASEGPLPTGSRAVTGAGADPSVVAALAGALLSGSRLAARALRPGLRPTAAVVEAWAVLTVAEADASVLRRPEAAEVVSAVARSLGRAPEQPPQTPVVRPAPDGTRLTERNTADNPVPTEPRRRDPADGRVPASVPAVPPAPVVTLLPDGDPEDPGRPTSWAGLLFLLATAAAAGIPDTVTDGPVLAARTLPWVLQGVALSLAQTGCADPAVAAFAGADPVSRPPWQREPAATARERDRIEGITDAWAAVTADALEPEGAPREPREVVGELVRRAGRIRCAPGWTDVLLRADEVDVGARRAGLDLDPGWVPWLGTVVRFVYV